MINRRQFNLKLAACTGLGVGIATGLVPVSALASWPASAFDTENVGDATNALYGGTDALETDAITFKAPDIAENGRVVPVTISVGLNNIDSIALMVPENPAPLVATFEMSKQSNVSVGTRIKMGKTSPLVAVVKADGKIYTASSKEVKVTIGGCGG